MHCPLTGSGTQTVGMPSFMGIPSAPGYVPKYWSNARFSCMMMITCLILWIPQRDWLRQGILPAG